MSTYTTIITNIIKTMHLFDFNHIETIPFKYRVFDGRPFYIYSIYYADD